MNSPLFFYHGMRCRPGCVLRFGQCCCPSRTAEAAGDFRGTRDTTPVSCIGISVCRRCTALWFGIDAPAWWQRGNASKAMTDGPAGVIADALLLRPRASSGGGGGFAATQTCCSSTSAAPAAVPPASVSYIDNCYSYCFTATSIHHFNRQALQPSAFGRCGRFGRSCEQRAMRNVHRTGWLSQRIFCVPFSLSCLAFFIYTFFSFILSPQSDARRSSNCRGDRRRG